MAQVFTLDFTYKHFIHSAIVTVRELGNDHSVSAQLQGGSLAHIAPDGELNFRLSNASRQASPVSRPGYNELEASIREAVAQHLKQQSALEARRRL